jgi:hypothetical protein
LIKVNQNRYNRNNPNIRNGDKIFFVEDGQVRGYGTIFDLYMFDDAELCEIIGGPWGKAGDWVVCYNDWHWLEKPVQMKGFQGFRYVSRMPDDVQKKLTRPSSTKVPPETS